MSFRDVVKGVFGPKSQPELENLPVWMDPIELSQLRALVEAVAPRRVLEWGSGGSTRELLELCPFIERYVSIEHNAEWLAQVRDAVQDPRLELHLAAPAIREPVVDPRDSESRGRRRAWKLQAETDPLIMADYVGFPATLGIPFDFVLVDGRARCLCVRKGFELLRPGGVLVLHDAQREEYHQALKQVGRAIFLDPWVQGQICFVRKPDAQPV